MKTAPVLLLLLLGLGSVAFAQRGIVIHKDAPWDRDQFARVTPYKKLQKYPTVHNVEPMTGRALRVNSSLVQKDIEFPTPESLADIAEEPQIQKLEATIVDWTETLKRFPQAAKLLKPRLAELQANVAQFRSGKVKVAGEWMTPEALIAKRKREAEERERIAARLEREARATAAAAAEWSRQDALGRQRERMVQGELDEAAMRADEERRLEEEIQRRRELAERRAKMKPVERLATDEWITPPTLKDEKAREYQETLNVVAAELAKSNERIGFGRESQKMVLISPKQVIAFPPEALNPEVITEPGAEGDDAPPLVVLTAAEQKEALEVLPVDGTEPKKVSMVTVVTTKATDAEKLTKGLSHLIELCGGKRPEAAGVSSEDTKPAPEKTEAESTPAPAAPAP